VKRELELVLQLDPDFPPAYSLAGHVYHEVPELLGGDLKKAEELFRIGLTKDPRDTGIAWASRRSSSSAGAPPRPAGSCRRSSTRRTPATSPTGR